MQVPTKTTESCYDLTATNCICCGRDLVDAESVEQGIGPICRGKYASNIVFTEDMVVKAMTEIARSQEVFSPEQRMLMVALSEQTEGHRKLANYLIKFCSVIRDQKNIIFKVTPILRSLGYEILADKIEIDRVTATIKADPNDSNLLNLFTRTKRNSVYKRCLSWMKSIRGFIEVRHPSSGLRKGRLKCHAFPRSEKDKVLKALGKFYGNCQMSDCGNTTIIQEVSYQEMAQSLRPRIYRPRPQPVQPVQPVQPKSVGRSVEIQLVKVGDMVQIFAPYNFHFKNKVKGIKGRKAVYQGPKGQTKFKCWSVPIEQKSTLITILKDFFQGKKVKDYDGLEFVL